MWIPCRFGSWLAALSLLGVCLSCQPPRGEKNAKKNAGPATLKQDQAENDADDTHAFLIGKPAPELVADYAWNGELAKLADLKGQVVLVDFWAVWCGPCIIAFQHLRDWDQEFRSQGLTIVGLTTYHKYYGFDKKKGRLKFVGEKKEDPATGEEKVTGGLDAAGEHNMLRDFTAHHQLSYRLMTLSRPNWIKVNKDYQIQSIPVLVLIDRKGIVRMVKEGAAPHNMEALAAEIKKLLAEK